MRTCWGVSIRSRLFEAGEPLIKGSPGELARVSIRSRLFEAGELDGADMRDIKALFQSAPASLRRENGRALPAFFHFLEFQSAPASLRRENLRAKAAEEEDECFNPLPPL